MSDHRFRPFEDSKDRGVVLGFLVEALRIGTTEPVDIEANEAASSGWAGPWRRSTVPVRAADPAMLPTMKNP